MFLGVAAGAMIAGIPGALFAIPLIAFVNATLLYVVGRDPSPDLGHDRASAEHFAALTRGTPARERRRAGAAPDAADTAADDDGPVPVGRCRGGRDPPRRSRSPSRRSRRPRRSKQTAPRPREDEQQD